MIVCALQYDSPVKQAHSYLLPSFDLSLHTCANCTGFFLLKSLFVLCYSESSSSNCWRLRLLAAVDVLLMVCTNVHYYSSSSSDKSEINSESAM
jgi:hypothetical protein